MIAICAIHREIFDEQRTIGPWFHFVWAVIYAIPCGIIALAERSWILGLIFVFERAMLYNPILNYMRHRPFFYLGSVAITDQVYGNYYPYIWAAYTAGFISLQFVL